MSEFLGVIQQIVQNTIKAMRLTDKATGTVMSVTPLSVRVDMTKQAIPAAGLILTEAVKERIVPVSGGAGGTVVVHEGLKVGDKVLMMRVQHGNQYMILSRVVS